MFEKTHFTFCLLSAALSGFAFVQVVQADAPLEGTKPAHCRLIWTSDPATTALISWSTVQQGKEHSVFFHERDQPDNKGVKIAESGRFTGGELELYYHHVRLTDLKPATAYEVMIESDREKSPTFYFITAPDIDRPFSMLHGGDSRSDQEIRRKMNMLMSQLFSDSFANADSADDILALAHGGDYIVSGRSLSQWSEWLSDHELTTAKDGRLLPIIPARGNHDSGPIFNEVFGFPVKDLNYYAINLTPQMRFVTLNTETSTAGDQAKWLEKELSSTRPNNRWLLVQYHKPVFPAVKSPSSALKSWVPLFEKYNIDLACEADGHNIKRTVPIRNNKPDENGVVYIGEGGLGVPQRTPKTDRWFLQSPGMADKGHHVFLLTLDEEKLTGQCILLDRKVRDRFTRNVRE